MSELDPLLEAVRTVRQRIFASRFLELCARYWTWCLAALLVPVALLPRIMAIWIALAAILAATSFSLFQAWRQRPSSYAAAQVVDERTGLKDRVSTALHFASQPGPVFACQRRDALASLGRVEPQQITPVWKPMLFRYPLVLVLLLSALVAYHPKNAPPVRRVLERVHAQLAESMQALDLPLLRQKKQPAPLGVPALPENLLAGLRPELAGTIEPEPGGSGLEQEFASGPAGQNLGSEASDSSAQGSPSSQSASSQQQAKQGGTQSGSKDGAAQGAQQPGADSSQQGGEGQSGQQASQQPLSLGQKIKQAFKGLMSALNGNASPQQGEGDASQGNDQNANNSDNNSKGGKQSDSGQSAASKASGQPSDASSAAKGDQALAIRGTGSQSGMPPETTGGPRQESFGASSEGTPEVQATPEVVPLQAVPFKGEANVRAELESGKAMLPYSSTMPTGSVTTDGAEHGTLPLRYRMHVKKYFDHSGESTKPDSTNKGN